MKCEAPQTELLCTARLRDPVHTMLGSGGFRALGGSSLPTSTTHSHPLLSQCLTPTPRRTASPHSITLVGSSYRSLRHNRRPTEIQRAPRPQGPEEGNHSWDDRVQYGKFDNPEKARLAVRRLVITSVYTGEQQEVNRQSKKAALDHPAQPLSKVRRTLPTILSPKHDASPTTSRPHRGLIGICRDRSKKHFLLSLRVAAHILTLPSPPSIVSLVEAMSNISPVRSTKRPIASSIYFRKTFAPSAPSLSQPFVHLFIQIICDPVAWSVHAKTVTLIKNRSVHLVELSPGEELSGEVRESVGR